MKSLILKLAVVLVLTTSYFPLTTSVLLAASDPITDLTASTGAASGSIILSWTFPGPTDLTSGGTYYIQYSSWTNSSEIVWSTANAQIVISTTASSALSLHDYICYGLGNGVTSYFRVWLSSSNSASMDISDISSGATYYAKPYIIDQVPNAVTSLVVISTGAASAKLSWTAVNDPDLLGYAVYRSSSPTTIGYSYVASVNSGTSYYYENGLNPDVTYYYIVRSSDTIQQSSSLYFSTATVSPTYVSVAANQAFNASKDLSVSFWMYPVDIHNVYQYVVWKNNYGNSWKILLPWSDVPNQIEFSNGNRSNACVAPNSVYLNTWTYITATYDSKLKQMKIYVNGSLRNTTAANTVGADFNANVEFSNSATPEVRFGGQLDDIMLYNRALSQTEITSIYSSGAVPDYGQTGWWKLSGKSTADTTAPDAMGQNNGAITGRKLWFDGKAGRAVSICASGALAAGPSALYYPQEGSWTNWPQADWADVSSAIEYNLQVADNSDFSPAAQDDVFAVSQGAFSGLNQNTLYWWRARAQMGEMGYTDWSSTKTFKLDYTNPVVSLNESQKLDTSWVDASSIYIDTYPVNVRGTVQDTYSGLRVGQTEIAASSSCVMLLHMNEGAGTVLADVSGRGNNGKAESGAVWTTGRFSNGLSFNGTSSSATVLNNALLNPSNITIEAWINPAGKLGEQLILEKRSFGGYAFIMFGGAGTSTLQAKLAGPNNEPCIAEGAVTNGVWSHIAMAYDNDTLRLYINGQVVASSQPVVTARDITGSGFPIKIGSNELFGLFYQGLMDELAVFNTALSPETIASHYNSGALRYSTNGGSSWTLVTSTNATAVTGTDGTTAAQTDTVPALPLTEGGNNRVQYLMSDFAGNFTQSSAFTVLVDTTPPPTINDLAVTSGTAIGDMRMTWTVPVDAKSGMTTGRYQIKYSSVPTDVYTVAFDTNAVSGWQTFVATGLPINTYFWFNVQARDNAGNWNVVSDSISYRYISDPTPPAGISNLTALPGATNRTITLRWTAPGNDEMASAIIGGSFRVRYSSHAIITADNFDSAPYSNYTVDMTTTVNPGDPCTYTTPATLTPAATYWFAVKTYDGANWSVWNSSGDVATVNTLAWTYAPGSSDVTAPSAITTLSGLVGTDGQINLTWVSPGDDNTTGNLPAGSQFNIQYATYNAVWTAGSGQITINAQGTIPFSATTYQLNGLNPDATYYFRIWTVDEAPNWSSISNGATIYLVNSPAIYIPADTNKTNTPYADWADVSNAVDYQAIFADNSEFVSPAITSVTALSRVSIASLADGTYWYKVRARLWNDVYTPWSATRSFLLDYSMPNVNTLTSLSNTSVHVNVSDGGSGLRVGQSEIAASSGCVLLLHMNEGSGLVASDASGYGSNGTFGAATSWTTGKFSNALSFNGTSSSITVDNSASLNPANITAEAWVYPTGKDGEQEIMEKRSSGGFNLMVFGASGIYNVVANVKGPGAAENGGQVYVSYGTISANIWSHLAMSYDGSYIRMYVNGELVASSQTIATVNITGSPNPLLIGKGNEWEGNFFWFQGKIDEAAVFNRALSPEEIAAHYYSGAVKYSTDAGANWTIAPSKAVMTATDITATNIPFSNNPTNDKVIFLAQDQAGNVASNIFSVVGDTIPPSAINNLSTSGKTETSLTLTWASPGDDGALGALASGSFFKIQYSSFTPVTWSTASAQVSFPAAGTAAGATVSRTVSTLVKDTTYYFRAWTSDEKSQWSDISNGATDYTSNDTAAPTVTGLQIENAGILGSPIVFLSTATDTSGINYIKLWYKLFDAAWASVNMTLTDVTGGKAGEYTLAGSNVNKEGTISYYLEAADSQGNLGYWNSQSAPQEITVSRTTVFTPIQTGTVALPNNDAKHGQVALDIPAGALPGAVAITIRQDNPLLEPAAKDDTVDRAKNGGKPVASYTFEPSGTKFAKPITLTLLYFDPNDTGAIQLEDGTSAGIDENTSVMQIFYWDGVNWRLLGGTIDKAKNTVSIKINHFSKYAIFPLGSALLKAAPDEKFITPNMPASFGYKADEVVIMDIAGNKVKEMTKTDFGGGSIQWNGYDDNGKFVESGVYLFKIKTDENKTTYGMIVVAK